MDFIWHVNLYSYLDKPDTQDFIFYIGQSGQNRTTMYLNAISYGL